MKKYTVRKAAVNDARLLADTRILQLQDEGSRMIYDTRGEMIDFFERKIADGSYVQLIAEKDGELISTAGVLYQEYPPSISWLGAKRGYVCNVYTAPAYRGQGIASDLIRRIILDAKEKQTACLWLMASKQGKSVYKKLGFDDERPGLDVYMEWYEP